MAENNIKAYPITKFKFNIGIYKNEFEIDPPNLGSESNFAIEAATAKSSVGADYTQYYKLSGTVYFNTNDSTLIGGIKSIGGEIFTPFTVQLGNGANLENQGDIRIQCFQASVSPVNLAVKFETAQGWFKGSISISGFAFSLDQIMSIVS